VARRVSHLAFRDHRHSRRRFVIIIGIIRKQGEARKEDEKIPVPTHGLKIADGERGGQGRQSRRRGGEQKKEAVEQRFVEPMRQIPAAEVKGT
jgi:hypothetical protein